MTDKETNLADKISKQIISIDTEYGRRIARAQEVRRVARCAINRQYSVTVDLAKQHKVRQLRELRSVV